MTPVRAYLLGILTTLLLVDAWALLRFKGWGL